MAVTAPAPVQTASAPPKLKRAMLLWAVIGLDSATVPAKDAS